MRSYAIGDVHGHIEKLQQAHERIEADRKRVGDWQAPVVHIGDFPDRGPNVRAVLDFLIDGIAAQEPWVALKGNHDRMMSLFLQPREQRDPLRSDLHWLSPVIGGAETLKSYGVDASQSRPTDEIHQDAISAVPDSHISFLSERKTSFRRGDVFFCHAGIRPGIPLENQDEDDLVWIRNDFLDDPRDHGALIVHGHTPVKAVTHHGNRLNIDSGAAYGGPLSAVVIEGRDVWLLTDEGRKPVLPIGYL